ncbi:MAG: hypothetical protein F6K26_07965 [Moorea sp. SIO2I5]|nr:hypothetical protein [Moorena sp. SIO2I5]
MRIQFGEINKIVFSKYALVSGNLFGHFTKKTQTYASSFPTNSLVAAVHPLTEEQYKQQCLQD